MLLLPDRFSTRTVCRNVCSICRASRRARMSADEAGPKPTTILIGCDGQVWADAPDAARATAARQRAAIRRRPIASPRATDIPLVLLVRRHRVRDGVGDLAILAACARSQPRD